jgi:hypothetical protein
MKKNSNNFSENDEKLLQQCKLAALDVLRHNAKGPCVGLPRTAGWGYPEPYTRDLMISSPGILVTGQKDLIKALKKTFLSLARNQTKLGHIPSLAHNPHDCGASDTTPLFLFALALYRIVMQEPDFLEEEAVKAFTWMEYQSPDDLVMVAQLPTSDWRDEHWVLGFGLYVNTIVYACLRLYHKHEKAHLFRQLMNRFEVRNETKHHYIHRGLKLPDKPYYAMSAYKIYRDERFDLLGNSLAILTGIASPSRARDIISWVEDECNDLQERGDLVVNLPPCLFPYIQPTDPDWRARYDQINRPGDYHNGGIWPFICSFYIAACVAAERHRLAKEKLVEMTKHLKLWRHRHVDDFDWGFNEWIKPQTGKPCGRDWQTWSAAMYLYASDCVEKQKTPFFDEIRSMKDR